MQRVKGDGNEFKLWGDKQVEATNETLIKLNNSLDIDKRLYNEDIDGSQAYAKALTDVGIITNDEKGLITRSLEEIRQMWEHDTIKFKSTDEDVHTVNERLLTEMVGAVGAKLHTGRSRNDQVAVDVKLWLKKAITGMKIKVLNVIDAMATLSDDQIEVLMPGYTHLQRAQAIRFSHWMLSYCFNLKVFETLHFLYLK